MKARIILFLFTSSLLSSSAQNTKPFSFNPTRDKNYAISVICYYGTSHSQSNESGEIVYDNAIYAVLQPTYVTPQYFLKRRFSSKGNIDTFAIHLPVPKVHEYVLPPEQYEPQHILLVKKKLQDAIQKAELLHQNIPIAHGPYAAMAILMVYT